MVDLAQLLQVAAAAQRANNWEQAERAYRQALALAPHETRIRRDLAWTLFASGNHDAGLAELRNAATAEPSGAIYNDLALMLRQAGHEDEAISCFERAIQLDPAMWQARFNLGNLYHRRGQFDLAADCYTAALRHAPDDPDVYLNLGITQKQLGQLGAARASFEQAIARQRDNTDAWINLGTAFKAEGNVDRAMQCYRQALAIDPKCVKAHHNMGLALFGLNQLAAAVDSYQQATRCDPNYGPAWEHLGKAYQSQGKTAAARDCFDRALRLTGDDAMKVKRALALPVILESAKQIGEVRRQLAVDLDALAAASLHIADPQRSIGAPAFALAYHGCNERQIQTQIATILRKATPSLAYVAPHCQSAAEHRPGRPIRVGFISAHFRMHTIGKLSAGLIERLDRDAFEVFVLRFACDEDEMARRIEAAADACVTLPGQLADARREIARCELDVLIYTDIGFDPLTYYLAHARLAPAQCVTWGHPLTTGIPTLDFFISSEHLEPEGAQSHYTEKLVRLPHLANYYDRPDLTASSKTRQDFGLSTDVHVYGCLQSLFKLHPDDDAVFADILRRDPQGRLALLEGNFPNWTELIRERFRRSIPDVCDRIDFIPYQTPADFLRLLASVDVLLDPLHYGGGETSYQSFAVGTPIVTLPSGFLRGRITYALYRAMGIDAMVANSTDDYVSRAVRLAIDEGWRDRQRSSILSAGDKIFENPAGVRDLEAFLTSPSEH